MISSGRDVINAPLLVALRKDWSGLCNKRKKEKTFNKQNRLYTPSRENMEKKIQRLLDEPFKLTGRHTVWILLLGVEIVPNIHPD